MGTHNRQYHSETSNTIVMKLWILSLALLLAVAALTPVQGGLFDSDGDGLTDDLEDDDDDGDGLANDDDDDDDGDGILDEDEDDDSDGLTNADDPDDDGDGILDENDEL